MPSSHHSAKSASHIFSLITIDAKWSLMREAIGWLTEAHAQPAGPPVLMILELREDAENSRPRWHGD